MARLAAIAKSNTECNPHFFVVNRGQEYWAVNITDPAVSFAFGPSTKTRVISQLVNGSATIQTLIDEGQPLAEAESRSSQSPGFKLRDGNGEEVVEGEPFALQVLTRNDGDEYDSEDDNWPCVMFDGKDWISTSKDFIMPDEIPTLYSTHRRIQISYDTNNDIMLSAWPTGHKAICEWIKFAYGHISLRDAHKNVSDKQSMRLRVVKI
ncbi:hypothetical protein GGI04_005061 [Coemansia thaxteri]|nr:hypothetical protein GGI04_005061 [Coemansia thaxteri]